MQLIDMHEDKSAKVSARTWISEHWFSLRPAVRTAFVAQFVLWIAVAVPLFLHQRDPVPFSTLSSESVPAGDEIKIEIIFSRTASSEHMRRLLVDIGADIISGPTSNGGYIVAVDADTVADLQRTLTQSLIVHSFATRGSGSIP